MRFPDRWLAVLRIAVGVWFLKALWTKLSITLLWGVLPVPIASDRWIQTMPTLVARYADACNLFPTPELPRKLEVLREHCEAAGRDYDSIMKTCTSRFEVGEDGSGVDAVLGQMQWLAGLGIEAVFGGVKDVWKIKPLEIMGREVIPAAAAL